MQKLKISFYLNIFQTRNTSIQYELFEVGLFLLKNEIKNVFSTGLFFFFFVYSMPMQS